MTKIKSIISKYPVTLAIIMLFSILFILAIIFTHFVSEINSPGVGWGITFGVLGLFTIFGIGVVIYLCWLLLNIIICYLNKSK